LLFGAGNAPRSLIAPDVDGDRKLDLIVANRPVIGTPARAPLVRLGALA